MPWSPQKQRERERERKRDRERERELIMISRKLIRICMLTLHNAQTSAYIEKKENKKGEGEGEADEQVPRHTHSS
jgi:hypothetical protein